MTTVAERGRPSGRKSGQFEYLRGSSGSLRFAADLARMLDVDETRAAVRREGEPRDLAADRAGEEAPECAARRIDGQQLVVAEQRNSPLLRRDGEMSVIDPQHGLADRTRTPSGLANASPCDLPCQFGRLAPGSPASTSMSQRNAVAVGSSPASRQRTIWPRRLLARGLAASVAGKPGLPRSALLVSVHDDLARLLVRRRSTRDGPSSSRPRGRAAKRVLTSTSAWSRKPLAGGEPALSMHERQPLAAAVGVEARDVERAVVEQRRDWLRAGPASTLSRLTNL